MPKTSTASMQISAERTQYRVGHGGFHSTIVTVPRLPKQQPLVYVYDIGAKPSVALARDPIEDFIDRLKTLKANRVEYVILSHIDEDHVNGLKDLLEKLHAANIDVGMVMLPWLSTTEKLMAKAHTNHRGPSTVVMNLTGDDRDTVGYLAGFGVEGVAFLLADDSTAPPQDPPSAPNSNGTPVRARFVASGTDLTASHKIPWKLVAMRMEPPKKTIPEFTQKIKDLTGLDPDDPAKHHELLTTCRAKISQAMTAAASSVGLVGFGHSLTNWSCISIFGSSPTPVAHHSINIPTPGHFKVDCDHGWLHTGDLPLHIPNVWQAFECVWNTHLPTVAVCALTAPHHGSDNGHNASLYARFKPRAAIFTTGLSSHSRPGSPIYSQRNDPQNAMQDARITAVVIELNN